MVRRLIWWQKAKWSPPFPAESKDSVGLSGISTSFGVLSRIIRQIIYALLTRAPLNWSASTSIPFDLHVLGTPPAFVLSQDQTLQFVLKVCNSKTYYWQKNYTITCHCYSVFKDQLCNQTNNILKSSRPVNKFLQTAALFFEHLSNNLSAQKGLAFYHRQFQIVKIKMHGS